VNIRIGTRGSKLALWQSNTVKNLIEQAFPECSVSLEIIQTQGDKILDVALSKIGDKNLFTKEIEQAMLQNKVDIAVHSKLGVKLNELTPHHIIGTSSLRRKAQLLALNPQLQIHDIRGNVDTRLKKMEMGHYDALIMAAAGLQRLGYNEHITELITPTVMLPAVSQGIIGIECRNNDTQILEIIKALHDSTTWNMAIAERTFLNQMNGGCQLPLGCFTTLSNSNIEITATILSIDGKQKLTFSHTGNIEHAETVAKELAQMFYKAGAQEILNSIRHES
jgi:hydroxymethylbilane synthase